MSDPGAPEVSVIIPAYNAERFLEAALDSIRAQDHQPLEVIVVDDGSEDRTAEIARSRHDVQLVRQEHMGPSAARNNGIAAATGTYIAFHDADDLMHPHRIRLQVSFLEAHPEIDCVLGCWETFLDGGEPWDAPSFPRALDQPLSVQTPEAQAYLRSIGMTVLMRREALDAVGVFDTSLLGMEDVDWLFRLRDSGVPSVILPAVVSSKRIHRSNTSRDRREMQTGWIRMLKGAAERRHG